MDDEDDYRPPVHWGDMGGIAIAGAMSLFGLYLIVDMLLGGHPLAPFFAVSRPATESEPPMTLAPGEVRIHISPKNAQKPKKPAPKP